MFNVQLQISPRYIISLWTKLHQYKAGLEYYQEKALKKVGERYYDIIISHIGEYRGGEMIFQDVYWEELSYNWLEEKRAMGWVEEIWEATGDIKGSVRIFNVEKMPNGVSVFVGLKDISPATLTKAIRNEFGADYSGHDVPARPLFEPAKREMIFNDIHHKFIIDTFQYAAKCALGNVKYRT